MGGKKKKYFVEVWRTITGKGENEEGGHLSNLMF